MFHPGLYATSIERKVAWRRRHGMAVRPYYPFAAAKQAAYRARTRQAAQDLAARECTAIQQALQTRALADQCWELHELIDACSWTRTCRTGAWRAAQQGSWRVRAPTFTGWPPRACAGIAGRSSAWRSSGPPGEPRRAPRATRAQTVPGGVRPDTKEVRILSNMLSVHKSGREEDIQR
jgi:hypothetical protein